MALKSFFTKLLRQNESPKEEMTQDAEECEVRILTLFIVDDNTTFLKFMEAHLLNKQKEGIMEVVFQIETFNNGEECLANLHKEPDIILLDYYLSDGSIGMNGDEVFKQIMAYNPKLKVVMLSGNEEVKIVHELVKMGLRDYIIKDDEMFANLHSVLLDVYHTK